MKRLLFLIHLSIPLSLSGQQIADTARLLTEVIVSGYRYDRPISEVPVAVAALNRQNLNRFSHTSLLPVVNTVAGVRMEERSPGSYRFSIRGSLLRSPFGVRNVKMYWNSLPLTDAGGNTYLNLIDFNSIYSLEILKGPGASLYGAGTGGVVLLTNSITENAPLQFATVRGNYGLQQYNAGGQLKTGKVQAKIQYAHQQTDGYRDHSAMRRDAVNAEILYSVNAKNSLSSTLFYTDLFYETPGGLTKKQFEENPTQARPGAETLNASVGNKTFYAGVKHHYQWNEHWSTHTGLYGSQSDFRNPTFLNYEKRKENNFGGRMENQYTFESGYTKGKIIFGAEYQHLFASIQVNNNDQGSMGLQVFSNDELAATQGFGFLQGEIELPKKFIATVGVSGNFLTYRFIRHDPLPADHERKFDPVLSPRIAVLKKIIPSFSMYASISQGFSPPTLAEVRPSTNEYNDALEPEHGTSYEAGAKGYAFQEKITFDVALYNFSLKETIVVQRTPEGQDYFINAGETSQRGVEATLKWAPITNSKKFLSSLTLWCSYTYNHYRFKNYENDGNDYSGNKLTGVAPTIVVGGLDAFVRSIFYLHITTNFTDHIPLNDANTEYAKPYFLLGCKAGYMVSSSVLPLELFAGVDNALNEHYSLGHDLNAHNGRYYNAAPERNFYIGLKASVSFKKEK